ncbi:formyltetrahydrofolate deformylase [Providencia rettgeri]
MKFEDLPADIQLVAANCLSRLIMDGPHMEKEPMARLARDVKNAFIELFGSESESIDL